MIGTAKHKMQIKAVALSKRSKRNILPIAKFEQLREDNAGALSKRSKRNILPMVKSEQMRYDKAALCRNAQNVYFAYGKI